MRRCATNCERLSNSLSVPSPTSSGAAPPSELVVCPDYRIGDQVIRTVSMVARFDNALELTLAELQIELTYPRDATSERVFRQHTATRVAPRHPSAPLPQRRA